jgi:hypothetical protein
MAAFADYLDLKFAVSETVNSRAISAEFPRFVLQAEAMLNRVLRCNEQITEDTLTFASGVATLPTDFLEMIAVHDSYGNPLRASAIGTTRLEGTQYNWYAIRGSQILIKGLSGDRDITYYAELPTLTTSASTSNWLLASHPNVYLYAVSHEAAKFLRDADQAGTLAALLDQELASLKVSDDRTRWGNAAVRVQGITP